jgi:17beta-estradiol 17-dehydrogenase / very-long-chain 3-oxoacyl-CoA reductase
MGLDPKVKNLLIFLSTRGSVVVGSIYLLLKVTGETDIIKLTGIVVLLIAAWRIPLEIYRHHLLPPKAPKSYGKWAIVTGSTSGIGKSFAEHLAKTGMDIVLISRTQSKLDEQTEEIKKLYGVECRNIAYDFTKMGDERKIFYKALDRECEYLDKNGGVGLLINNVGTANEIPKILDEFSDMDIEDMIHCNIFSTVFMSRTVMKYMKARKNGAIVSISSGSCNHVGPFLCVYSATKAFMTQFSRSMHVECWGTGVDFLVVTPFYVVSNLYKRRSGTIIAPMPIELVKGTLAQLGKKWVWQSHGYWFHAVIGVFATYYWGMTERYRKMMTDNRKRYDEKQLEKAKKQ